MQTLGNVYICGSPFVMSRTDAQNGLDMVFKPMCTKQCGNNRIKKAIIPWARVQYINGTVYLYLSVFKQLSGENMQSFESILEF
jgi:hypothetical protein